MRRWGRGDLGLLGGMFVFRDDPHDPGLRAILIALRPQYRAALDLGFDMSPRWGELKVGPFN